MQETELLRDDLRRLGHHVIIAHAKREPVVLSGRTFSLGIQCDA